MFLPKAQNEAINNDGFSTKKQESKLRKMKLSFTLKFFRKGRTVRPTSIIEQYPPSSYCVSEITPDTKRRNGICLEIELNHFDEEGLLLAEQHRGLIAKIRHEDIGIMY